MALPHQYLQLIYLLIIFVSLFELVRMQRGNEDLLTEFPDECPPISYSITKKRLFVMFCGSTDTEAINDLQRISSKELRKNSNVVMLNACKSTYEPIFNPADLMEYLRNISLYFPGVQNFESDTIVTLAIDDTIWSTNSLEKIYRRYDCVRGMKNLVVSTKTFCEISNEICTDAQLKLFYGDLQNANNSFSIFLNSGMVMGSISAVEHLLTYLIDKKSKIVGRPEAIGDVSYELLMHYYAKNFPSFVAFDYNQKIFGSYPIHGPALSTQTSEQHNQYVCRNSSLHIGLGRGCSNHAPVWFMFNGFRVSADGTCSIVRQHSVKLTTTPIRQKHIIALRASRDILVTQSHDPVMWQSLGSIGIYSTLAKQLYECHNEVKNESSNYSIPIVDPSKVSPPNCDFVKGHKMQTKLYVAVCDSNSGNDIEGLFNVSSLHFRSNLEVRNVCVGVQKWHRLGFFNKPLHYLKYVDTILEKQKTFDPTLPPTRVLVLLMDSDTFWSIESLEELYLKYDCVRGSKDLVVSTETSCWTGKLCDMNALDKFYSGRPASPSYSSFINSGLIMGSILNIREMLKFFVENKDRLLVPRKKGSTYSDQFALHEYIRLFPILVSLDYHQLLFGSFPLSVYASQKGTGVCEIPSRQSKAKESYSMNCTDLTSFISSHGVYIVNPKRHCNIERMNHLPLQFLNQRKTFEKSRLIEGANEVLRTISSIPAIWHCQGVDGKIRMNKFENEVHKCLNDGETSHSYGVFKIFDRIKINNAGKKMNHLA